MTTEFEQIYTEFRPGIYRYLTRFIGVKDAEDLTQDVFVKVAKAFDGYNNKSQLSTWIYQIAKNAAIDKLRSDSFKQVSSEKFLLIEEHLNVENLRSDKRQLSIEEQVMRIEVNECIQAIIATLPQNYKTILTFSEIEGLKNNEIAGMLGLSVSAVKARLHRAKVKLKKELLENCEFYRTECCGRLVCGPKKPVQPIK